MPSYSIRIFNMNTYYFQVFFKNQYSTTPMKTSYLISFLMQETPEYNDLDENAHDSKTIVWLTVFFLPVSNQFNNNF